MMLRQRAAIKALVILCVAGAGISPGSAQTTNGPPLAVQADGLVLWGLRSNGSAALSPFLALELRVLWKLSLRIGLSPPLGQESGQQAFATHLAFNVWLGRGPGFIETGLGSYYQNTWCNGRPDYRAYTLYLGWRRVSKSAVVRIGGIAGLTPGGKMVLGLGLGFGRSVGSSRPYRII